MLGISGDADDDDDVCVCVQGPLGLPRTQCDEGRGVWVSMIMMLMMMMCAGSPPVYLALQVVKAEVLRISDDDDVCRVPPVYLELSVVKAEVFGYQ